MYKTHVPLLIRNIVVAALVAQVICTLINLKWKISIHMVGMGGLTGVDFALSNLFFFNPLLPGCILILLSGLVGSSRMVLRQHSLLQVVVGFAVGFVCAMLFTLSTWMV
jgi:membrane-associated phospholipid phosphatase